MTVRASDPARGAKQAVVIVTGPSGAGRSTAVAALEDMGYEAIDNIPISLIPRLLSGEPLERPLALGVDARNREFTPASVLSLLDELAAREGLSVELLYLDCPAPVLLRRFSETRRRHPLAPTGSPEEGVAHERELLAPLRARADFLIDTGDLSPHDLREELRARLMRAGGMGLAVSIQSFSFKRGMPRGFDMVFDVRFLRNPHWERELRPLDGRDRAVADHIRADPMLATFEGQVHRLIRDLLPAFEREGKSHLSIGIGCTGGRHRSVFVAENLAKVLAKEGWQVSIRHRELSRRANHQAGRGNRGEGL